MPAYIVEFPVGSGGSLGAGADTFTVFAATTAIARDLCAARYTGDASARAAEATVTEVTNGADAANLAYRVQVTTAAGTQIADFTGKPEGVSALAATATVNVGGTATYVVGDILTLADPGNDALKSATYRVTTVSTGVVTGVELADPGHYLSTPANATGVATTGGSGGGDCTLDVAFGTGEFESIFGHLSYLAGLETEFSAPTMDYAAATPLLTIAIIADNVGDHTIISNMVANSGQTDIPMTGMAGTLVHEGIAGAVLTVAIPNANNPLIYAEAKAV